MSLIFRPTVNHDVNLSTSAPLWYESAAFAAVIANRVLLRGDAVSIEIAEFAPVKPFRFSDDHLCEFEHIAKDLTAHLTNPEQISAQRMRLTQNVEWSLNLHQPMHAEAAIVADTEFVQQIVRSQGHDALIYTAQYLTEKRVSGPAGVSRGSLVIEGTQCSVQEIRVLDPSTLTPVASVEIEVPRDVLKLKAYSPRPSTRSGAAKPPP